MKPKKYLILLVLKILENETDETHPITQSQIARNLSEIFPCDRKTVCRNIAFLKKIGYPIEKTTKGFYLKGKRFSLKEREFILQSILTSNLPCPSDKSDLIKRLSELLDKIYRQKGV